MYLNQTNKINSDWEVKGHCLKYDQTNGGLYATPFADGCLNAGEWLFLISYSGGIGLAILAPFLVVIIPKFKKRN